MRKFAKLSGAAGAVALLASSVSAHAQTPQAVAAAPAMMVVNSLLETQIAVLTPVFANLCFGGAQGCVLPLRAAKPVVVPPPPVDAVPPVAGGAAAGAAGAATGGAAGGVATGGAVGGGILGGGIIGIGALAALAGVIFAASSNGNGNDSAGG